MSSRFFFGRMNIIYNLAIAVVFLALYSTAPAHAGALDRLLDSIAEQITDSVNRNILKEEVDQDTRRLQVSATKVLLRGKEKDWDNLIEAALGTGESISGTQTARSRTTSSSKRSQRRSMEQYRRTIERNLRPKIRSRVPPPAKPTFLSTMIEGKPINIKASPVHIQFLESGIQIKANLYGIVSIESDGNPETREYLLYVKYEPANYEEQGHREFADGIAISEAIRGYLWGEVFLIIDEEDKEVDIGSAALEMYELGFRDETLLDYIDINCPPPIYIYDWDKDGIDEILVFDYLFVRGEEQYGFHILRKIEPLKEYEKRFGSNLIYNDNTEAYMVKKFLSESNVGVIVDEDGINFSRISIINNFAHDETHTYTVKRKTHSIRFERGVLDPIVNTTTEYSCKFNKAR